MSTSFNKNNNAPSPLVVAASIVAVLLGALVFAIYHNWIIFNVPFLGSSRIATQQIATEKKQVAIYALKNNTLIKETKEILWPASVAEKTAMITHAWLAFLSEESILERKLLLQDASTTANDTIAIISLDHNPFDAAMATKEKLLLIESLCQTLREQVKTITAVKLLVKHAPLNDPHLDFSHAWPVAGYSNQTIPDITNCMVESKGALPLTIILNPSCDATRIIGDSSERAIALEYATHIKQELESRLPGARIEIAQGTEGTCNALQAATISNTIKADLYVSLNAYQVKQDPCTCALYFFSYNPLTDFSEKKEERNAVFESLSQSYLTTICNSAYYASLLHNKLEKLSKKGAIRLAQTVALPFKPLMGVKAPAIGCECGLNNKDAWKLSVPAIVDGISVIAEKIMHARPQEPAPTENIATQPQALSEAEVPQEASPAPALQQTIESATPGTPPEDTDKEIDRQQQPRAVEVQYAVDPTASEQSADERLI